MHTSLSRAILATMTHSQMSVWVSTILARKRGLSFSRYVARLVTENCDRCGGMPDLDEEGRAYTCFHCCDTGRVTMPKGYFEREHNERLAYLDEQARAQGFESRAQQDAALAHTAALRAKVESTTAFGEPRGAGDTFAALWSDLPF